MTRVDSLPAKVARAAHPPDAQVPGLRRRLASMVYEGVVLFGVLMLFGFIYSTFTQQRHALSGRFGLQAFLFVMLGLYFTWFWSHGRQTVAMKTWHIRIETITGAPVSLPRAMARYLLAWLWFVPALLVCWLAGWHDSGSVFGALGIGVLVYAEASRWIPQRQFLHDHLCGTRLVLRNPPAKPTR